MPKAKITYINGMQFVGRAESGHAIVMDSDKAFGGEDTGPRPMELLLIGLGGCSGMDIASVLRKKKEQFTGIEISVNGTKAKEYPQKYTGIEIVFTVKGKNLSHEAVRRAVELSMTKYCSVKATLEGAADVSYSFEIVEE